MPSFSHELHQTELPALRGSASPLDLQWHDRVDGPHASEAADLSDLADLFDLIVLSNTRLLAAVDPSSWPAELARAAIIAAERGLTLAGQMLGADIVDGAANTDPSAGEMTTLTQPTVLVVDDDPRLLQLMSEAFTRGGFRTFSANNGRVAMQILRAAAPDLLVTDIVMPEMEGLATIREAKQLMPDLQVIAITGGGEYGRDRTYLRWAEHLGADEVLAKPFKCSSLLTAARLLLDRTRLGEPNPHDA